jgi:hypothetical protein
MAFVVLLSAPLMAACVPNIPTTTLPTETLTTTIISDPPPTPTITPTQNPTEIPVDLNDPVEIIISNMTLPHEGRPHGLPSSIDWYHGPRLSMGNDPGEFTALVAWGQFYEAAEGNPATNTRVEMCNIRAYILSKSDTEWHLVQFDRDVSGDLFNEDFADNYDKKADARYEPSGCKSATAGDGFVYHFWPATNGRVTIDPDDIAGLYTTIEARLVIDDPNKPDDRDQARYVLNMGADYWLDLTAEWDNYKTNGDAGIGRFKYVTTVWQAFNMITLSPEEIRSNPPPIEWSFLGD